MWIKGRIDSQKAGQESACDNTARSSRMDNIDSTRGMLKPTLILTTLLFLITAPEPDAQDIAEITANFIVADKHSVLLASTEQTGTEEKISRK
jgi:hypothetical protein